MLRILLKGHEYRYEVGELLKLFVGMDGFEFVEEETLGENQSFLLISYLSKEKEKIFITTQLFKNGNEVIEENKWEIACHSESIEMGKRIKRYIKRSLYDILVKFYHVVPPWGILTGIRPTKIVHELMDKQYDMDHIRKELKNEYRISEEKINLMTDIAKIERPFIFPINEEVVGLYIGIPFCPTRCVYCSFPSNPLDKGKNKIPEYLEALFYEIQEVGKLLREFDKKIETLYIGGGTPTTLSPLELEMLLKKCNEYLDLRTVKEITVEAGRPDTITREKLMVLKENNVNRISINPQTMNQRTLDVIGRSHTPENIIEIYQLAKEIGFETINMDLIIGLPGENIEMIEKTMKEIEKLDPENITVHTLAIKKSSRLKENLEKYPSVDEEEARKMLEITSDYARRMGLIPYYMYRQKYMVGNLENIGYCKPGHEGIYNIQIMEEKQSIVALGAGASSKIVYPKENRLERVANVTNVDQYIDRVDEMVQRKRRELEKDIDI